jgi:mannose-6-phosphate isomerase-like protein (cupin superfamily)
MGMQGIVVQPGQGLVVNYAPGRSIVLKLRCDETDGSIMMFEATAPVGTKSTLHLHHDSDEVAYVLSGEITFLIGDDVTVGGPGTTAFMPRGVRRARRARVVSLHPGRGRRVDRRAATDRQQLLIDDRNRAGRDAAALRLGTPRAVAVVTAPPGSPGGKHPARAPGASSV